jgi:hypothetical protein
MIKSCKVLYESISLLNLQAIICTVSKTNLPPQGILEALDKMENDRAPQSSTVVNGLATFMADVGYDMEESDYADESDAEQDVLMYFDHDTDSEGSQTRQDIPDKVLTWKARFDDREIICWVSKARHEEVSGAFLAVSRFAFTKLSCG